MATDSRVRVIIEIWKSPNVRIFHVGMRISESADLQIFVGGISQSTLSDFEELGEVGRRVVRDLFEIDGVTKVYIHSYHFQLMIGEAFDWESIEAGVLEIIQAVLNVSGLDTSIKVMSDVDPKADPRYTQSSLTTRQASEDVLQDMEENGLT